MFLKYYQKIDDALSYLFSSVSNEKKLIQNIFKKKYIVFVDVGTNEGNFLNFLSSFCNFKKIICFEPIQELTDKIDIKKYSNKILIYNIALSNKKSTKSLYQYNISSQSSLYKQNNLFKSLKKLKKKIKIKTISEVDNFNDIDSFAALINCLDLIITIQNSTAHLSCALGKKTWIMLANNARWHWLLNEKKSLWYPTATLFRQEKIGDWNTVINSIGMELKKLEIFKK